MLLPWGKSNPYKPLIYHLIDTGFTAQVLLKSSAFRRVLYELSKALGISEDEALKLCGFVAAGHDIGKCHPAFQGKADLDCLADLRDRHLLESDAPYLHEMGSARYLARWLKRHSPFSATVRRLLRSVVEMHHCRINRMGLGGEDETQLQRDFWAPLRTEMIYWLARRFEIADIQIAEQNIGTAGMLLSGLIVLADWIASNDELFASTYGSAASDIEQYCQISLETAVHAVDALGFNERFLCENSTSFSAVWPEIGTLRPMQSCVEMLCRTGISPGIAIIEAPMGEGKTEAAIYLAINWIRQSHGEGMYIALPTAATSNQMFDRVRHLLQSHHAAIIPRLVHGKAFIIDDQSYEGFHTDGQDEIAANWFRPLKRALISPFAVGTVDQAMFAALYVKYFQLRMFGLAGKVLIIDEVHAYDAYMSEIIERLLRWCGALEIPVILLSATLPLYKRRSFLQSYLGATDNGSLGNEYPSIVFGNGAEGIKTVPFAPTKRKEIFYELHQGMLGNAETVSELAYSLLQDDGCLCIIANTILSAQRIYEVLKRQSIQRGESCDIILFHARFTAARRSALEDQVLRLFGKDGNRPVRAILVATQVVEQSLDIDFDLMISELAPIDLLLQRAGRLHRHNRGKRRCQPVLHVLMPDAGDDFGSSGNVYDPFILNRTAEVLQANSKWQIPEDMRKCIEAVYGEQARVCAGYQEFIAANEQMKIEADKYLIPPPDQERFQLQPEAPFDEGDEGMKSFVQANTRMGPPNENLIVLENGELQDILAMPRCPSRKILAQVLQKAVNVPLNWLKDVCAKDGYAQLAEGPVWLRGYKVIRLVGGCWKGKSESSAVTILYDDELGMRIRKEDN